MRKPETDWASFLRTIAFASRKHRDQRRKDAAATPYISHPIDVANLLAAEAGVADLTTLQVAVLHDTMEDTATTYQELAEHFGHGVATAVAELTDDKSLGREERKHLQLENASKKSHRASLVKLADKTCNLRDLIDSPPVNWSADRKREYFDWARKVVYRLPPTSLELLAAFNAAYAKRAELT